MSISTLKFLLWLLMGLPLLVVGVFVFAHTVRDNKKANKARQINE